MASIQSQSRNTSPVVAHALNPVDTIALVLLILFAGNAFVSVPVRGR